MRFLKSFKFLIYFFFCCWLCTETAWAQNNFYEVSIPVNSQAADEEKLSFQQGLAAVLIKASGQAATINKNRALLAQIDPKNYLLSYHYTKVATDSKIQLYLTQTYEKNSIIKLLGQLNLRPWVEHRPQTLLWVRVNAQPDPYVLSENQTAAETVLLTAKQRGLPIILPLGDLTSLNQTQTMPETTELINLAKEYSAQLILIGQQTQNGSAWNGEWKIFDALDNSYYSSWQAEASSQEQGVSEAIEVATDLISREFGPQAIRQPPLTLSVSNIASLNDYVKIERYLKSLALVAEVWPQEINAEKISFVLQINGDLEKLAQIIKLDGRLQPTEDQETESKPFNLTYRWSA